MLPDIIVPSLNDGYIDSRDISLGVYMIINKYSLCKNGDYMKIYWGAESFVKTISDIKTDFPVIIRVDDNILNDGYVDIFYEVTDIAGNYNVSSAIDVLVCRNCSIPDVELPPLKIKDAEVDGFINKSEVEHNAGVILYIEKNNKFNISDKIIINWQEKYPNGTPVVGSYVSNEVEINTSHLEHGISITIPSEKAYLADSGTMWCSYTLFSAQGDINFSNTTTAAFQFSEQGILPAPIINNKGQNNTLSIPVILKEHGADIIIPKSESLKFGDIVNVYWSGYNNTGGEIPPAKVNFKLTYQSNNDLHVKVPIKNLVWISNGTGEVYYTVYDGNRTLTSPRDNATIIFNTDCRLTSLDIDGLKGDKLESSTIDKNNGVKLIISGDNLVKDSIINIYSDGYDENNIIVESTTYSTTYVVEQSAISQSITILIPSEYYINSSTITYNIGVYLAAEDYCGAFANFNIEDVSENTNGDLLASTGYYSWTGDTLQQCYVHCTNRKPNTEVTLDINGDAYFSANGATHIKSATDGNGSLKLSLSSSTPGVNEISVTDHEGNMSKVRLGAYDLSSLNSPWLEMVNIPSPTSQYYSFYARMNHGDNKCMLVTSNGEFYINDEAKGAVIYDYDIVEGADMQFELLVSGGFTVSLADYSGRPYCTYTV